MIRFHAFGSGLAALLNEEHSLAANLATPHTCNPSGVLFVLVPADSGLVVKKDDGVGGQVPFDEDIGAAGTGANGINLTFNGTAYKAYGEFSLIDADTVIYIEGE